MNMGEVGVSFYPAEIQRYSCLKEEAAQARLARFRLFRFFQACMVVMARILAMVANSRNNWERL